MVKPWNQNLHFNKLSWGLSCTVKIEEDQTRGLLEIYRITKRKNPLAFCVHTTRYLCLLLSLADSIFVFHVMHVDYLQSCLKHYNFYYFAKFTFFNMSTMLHLYSLYLFPYPWESFLHWSKHNVKQRND